MTTVVTYRSTDTSAPVLTGSAGTLVALLDACLVNGYGSKAAAGWTIAYTATNKRQYKNSAVDGTGSQVYIDDTGPGGAGGAEARMTGFKTGTAIGAGTGQFPTLAQSNIGIGAVVCRKSASADSTARAWTLVADDTVFYLFIETGDIFPVQTTSVMFGDIFSYASSDAYRAMIIGRCQENNGNFWRPERFAQFSSSGGSPSNLMTQTLCAHFIAANSSGVGGSLPCGKHTDAFKQGAASYGIGSETGNGDIPTNATWCMGAIYNGSGLYTSNFSYPNGPDGGLYVAPVWVHHQGSLRGYLKGIWAPLQTLPLTHNDTYSGSGTLAGKSFLVQSVMAGTENNAEPGQCHIETSSTWS